MSAGVRVGVGTRLRYDGETVVVVEFAATAAGNEVVLRDGRGRVSRVALRELLLTDRAVLVAEEPGPEPDDEAEPASVVLDQLGVVERAAVARRAGHVREMLTGFSSGSAQLPGEGEPRDQYRVELALEARYRAKAAELGVGVRTVKRWAADYRAHGEAGLVRAKSGGAGTRADERWVAMALEVMAEHVGESKPSRSMVIERARARSVARYGPGVVAAPSRATAFRVLEDLERRLPTFRLSAKRNRDIAGRPQGVYGKLRPTRPGEYLLMDSTRLDVFAFDPLTLRWAAAELTVAMDWYTRCVLGIRLTPVSTKAVDAAAVLFQVYRPRPAPATWPRYALWPEHGIPRAVLLDQDTMTLGAAGPALAPETVVIDHGKIYVSDHLTSVCQRMGVSIQPARLRTGRDKGPVERFFRTLREDLLQTLPGYKGPDVFSRGEDVESEAFFFLDELEAIIREWVATVYHHREHEGLVDPGVAGLRLSPAKMFEHGMARAGYIEVPRHPDLAYEFLRTEWRSIQHYGVEIGRRRYNGPALTPYRNIRSRYQGPVKGAWPFQVDPDDITRIFFRDPAERRWHMLTWEHAPCGAMPLSEDALGFARALVACNYRYPDDRMAVAALLERWSLGLGASLPERRMLLRASRAQGDFALPRPEPVAAPLEVAAAEGDDDEGDFQGAGPGEAPGDFYADALGDA